MYKRQEHGEVNAHNREEQEEQVIGALVKSRSEQQLYFCLLYTSGTFNVPAALLPQYRGAAPIIGFTPILSSISAL